MNVFLIFVLVVALMVVFGVIAIFIDEEFGQAIDRALENGDWIPTRIFKAVYNSTSLEDTRTWVKFLISLIATIGALTLFVLVLILSLRYLEPIIFKKKDSK